MATPLLVVVASSLTFFLFFSLSNCLPHETVVDAADILSDSGFISMSLTLEVVSQTLLSQSPSVTIFAPSDSAFGKLGQPSLDLLRFHFAPLPLHLDSLRLIPSGTKIPTMFDGHSLVITTSESDSVVSLNNVKIIGPPVYDDGLFVIFGIDRFFDPTFELPVPVSNPVHNVTCGSVNNDSMSFMGSLSFGKASGSLRSGEFSVMATFLDMQLNGIKDQTGMTVFAPVDEAVLTRVGNISDFPSIFLRHVVPCKLIWNDMVNFNDGSELPTYMDGFTITVERSGGVLLLNKVPVFYPDMFSTDSLVVHGLRDVLIPRDKAQQNDEALSTQSEDKVADENVFSPGEF